MKLSVSLLVAPLLASHGAAGMECNANNCLRALRNPTRSAAATSFCRTFTASNVTATTSLPPQFATQCGSGPTQVARLSSACSCYVPPVSATPCDADTSSDSNNCGTCGNVCSPGTTCQSGTCTTIPPAANCTSYTAQCSTVMNSVLASNSIASPELVDYRIQSAQLGITSPTDFITSLGANPCEIFPDPAENSQCIQLLADSTFVNRLTSIVQGVLSGLQTCAANVVAGNPDYQIIISDTATCPATTRRHERRAGELDITQSMVDASEAARKSLPAPPHGREKSSGSDLILLSRQQSTCSGTGTCFERCPSCRDRETYCGTAATTLTTAVCAAIAGLGNAAAATAAGAACAAACAPLGPGAAFCAGFCGRAAGGLTAVAIGTTCAVTRNAICSPLTQRCDNCNSANNNICNPSSTQCCAGETGTQCGTNGCCCCPRCYAPGGINCECTLADC